MKNSKGTPVGEGAAWYRDRTLLPSFPILFRMLAAGLRQLPFRSNGTVIGEWRLTRLASKFAEMFASQSWATVKTANGWVTLDLLDSRFPWVIDELNHETSLERLLKNSLKEGDAFVDVGANHGSYSIIAAKLVGLSGLVLAVEPNGRLCSAVQRSADKNGYSNLTVVNQGCSDSSGTLELYRTKSFNSGSRSFHESNEHARQGETVLVDTLDAIWQKFGKCTGQQVVLKLDVEGHELFVLNGAQHFVRSARPTIIFELNPTRMRAAGYAGGDLLHRLHALGYVRSQSLDSAKQRCPTLEIDVTQKNDWVTSLQSDD